MAKTFFYMVCALILIFGAGVLLISGDNNTSTGVSGAENAQVARLSVEGINYALTPSEFEKGVPVRIEADMDKMPGCSRSVVISAFNVRKTVSRSDNVIEFTPTKTGTFTIACSMNMYRGTFTVK